MIKCNLGLVHIEGTGGIILVEFSTLVNSLKSDIPEEVLRAAFERGIDGPPSCNCEPCKDETTEDDTQPKSWDDVMEKIGELVAEGIRDGLESIMSERESKSAKKRDKDK